MRNRPIMVITYYNQKEYEVLVNLSKKTGLPMSTLMRSLVLGYSPPEGPKIEHREILYQLRRIGNNLNQALHIAHTSGILNPVEFEKELSNLRLVEDVLLSAYKVKKK